MSDTNNPFYTNEEWVQYYQETPANPSAPATFSGSSVDHDNTMMTSFNDGNVSISSSTIISGGGGADAGGVNNSGNKSPLKPVRRRSRVSKRTPVTLLNASASNFRALVQQFTGCPQATTSALLGRQKGPVNLSFGRDDYELSESNKSTFTSYDQQELTRTLPQQPHGSISRQSGVDNTFGETASRENGYIDESSLNGSNSTGGYYF